LPRTAIEPLKTRRRSFRVALVCNGLQWSAVVYSGLQWSARGVQIVPVSPSKSRRAPSSTIGSWHVRPLCQMRWNGGGRRAKASLAHSIGTLERGEETLPCIRSSPPRSTSAWPGETSGERGENVVALLNGSHSGMIEAYIPRLGVRLPVPPNSASRQTVIGIRPWARSTDF
jgi:hypothetical protein